MGWDEVCRPGEVDAIERAHFADFAEDGEADH